MHKLLLPCVATAQLLVPPKKMLFRTRDPLTNTTSGAWRKALAIDGFPTFMGVAEAHEKADDDVLAAMRWFIVPETGVVLLNPLVPLHYIYRHQHNARLGNDEPAHRRQDIIICLFLGLGHAHKRGKTVYR